MKIKKLNFLIIILGFVFANVNANGYLSNYPKSKTEMPKPKQPKKEDTVTTTVPTGASSPENEAKEMESFRRWKESQSRADS